MSGRGGGRGGWRGRGRGGPLGPQAKDEDGTIIDSAPAGPPPQFPEIELPLAPDHNPKSVLLAGRAQRLKDERIRSPFFLETTQEEKGDVDTLIERYASRQTSSKAGVGAGGGRGRGRKRRREPLASIIKPLPEYIPDELFSNADKRYASRLQESYWRRAAKVDEGGMSRLDALAQLEQAAKEGEGAAGGKAGGEGEGEGQEVVEDVVDTDEEEDMDGDDYYQGAHFDDDEGYDDDFGGDDGGDEGGVY